MGNIFLSPMSQEAHLARAIKGQLEQAVPGVETFVSGVDVQLGQAWLEAMDNAFADARAILVLCSRRSAERP
jgi:TIR domain